jgi:hypothetical protein
MKTGYKGVTNLSPLPSISILVPGVRHPEYVIQLWSNHPRLKYPGSFQGTKVAPAGFCQTPIF